MYTEQSTNCNHSDVNHHGSDDVLCRASSLSSLHSWLLMPQSLTSSFFSAFIRQPPTPSLWPGLYIFQLPELNNTLRHISMQPRPKKEEILFRPLPSVSVPRPLLFHPMASALHLTLCDFHICFLVTLHFRCFSLYLQDHHLSYSLLLLS